MRVLHEVMRVVVGPLQGCELKRFVVKTIELVEQKFVPLLVLYRYKIPESKNFFRNVTWCCGQESMC